MLTQAQTEALEALAAHDNNVSAAARSINISRASFRERLNAAKSKQIDPAIQAGMAALGMDTPPRGGWIKSHEKDENGLTYSFTFGNKDDEQDRLERIRAAFEGIPAALPVDAPLHCATDLLTLYPIADAHIGMMAWGEEAGEDYDTKIATQRLVDWMGRAVASSPDSATAIILDVGDLLHSDDQSNMTPRSKHILDADTRHFKTIDMTINALAVAVDLAKAKHSRVIVRILPGNHDPHAYMAILFALDQRYREDDRVTVQKVPGEYFAHQHGKCFLAAHHGDKAKAERMVMYMADRFPELWGKTRHRYLWTGHLHHHKSADIGGVQWEQLRALTARDAYASSHAYSARAQLQAVTYHRQLGEVQRVKVGLA